MNAKEIENNLELLGQELTSRGIMLPIRVLLVGGAYMLTQVKVRRTTDDIDVLPLDEEWQDKEGGIPLPVQLKEAVQAVSTNHKLDPKWFNASIAGFVGSAGILPNMILWRSFGPLEVYVPPNEYIFVLKLLANREKDRLDIAKLRERLHIQTREQAQQLIDSYIPDRDVQFFCGVHLTLKKRFKK